MNNKMLALYGLKWNPFAPNVPTEALHVTTRLESFCWRVQQLAGEGGFGLVTGAPGCGKSAALRILRNSMVLSMAIAQTHMEQMIRPSITVLTSQWACQNR